MNLSSYNECGLCLEQFKKSISLMKRHSEAVPISFQLAEKQNQNHILVLNPQKVMLDISQHIRGHLPGSHLDNEF